MLHVKITELGIEIRVREEIERGITPQDVIDPAYQPGNPLRYGSAEAWEKWQLERAAHQEGVADGF